MADTPEGEIRGTILLEVWRLARRTGPILDEVLEPAGLNATEYGLYSAIRLAEPVTPTVLSRRTGMPVTTVSQALKRLEDSGRVERSANPDDARSSVFSLSAFGRRQHDEAMASFRHVVSALTEALGAELDLVWYALRRLERALAGVAGSELADGDLPEPPDHGRLSYPGAPLTRAEEREVRQFIDWIRARKAG